MKKNYAGIWVAAMVLASAALLPVGVSAIELIVAEDITEMVIPKEHFVKTADSFIVLFDASGSMDEPFEKGATRTQYEVAVDLLRAGNERLPDLGYYGGLYLFTPFQEIHPVSFYQKEQFAQAIDSLPAEAKGPTFLAQGLREVEKMLENMAGKTAVFIFTDGTSTDPEGFTTPEAYTARMAEKHDVCFIIVSDAKTSAAQKRVRDMAKANACSRVVPFDQFVSNPNYITGALYFVKSSEEVITRVEKTVVGVKIDNVNFDFDKTDIRPEFRGELDELGGYLSDNPDAFALMAGFTDNVGGEDYNVELSFRRAKSVADYLMGNFSVDRKQLVLFGYGAANPIESNDSEEGRAINRRVEIAVGK